ncbi:sensor histidine kinase [Hydrogenimonas sp.]
MKRVEKESLTKSFLLFFLSMGLTVSALFYLDFSRSVDAMDHTIMQEMELCSYDLNCSDFAFDFVDLDAETLNRLERAKDGSLYSDFSIPGSNEYALRIKMPKKVYDERVAALKQATLERFAGAMAVVVLLSLLFSWYALQPLRNALNMTEEFVRDILHDFNTPLSTIRLNIAMLKRRHGESGEVGRIEKGVQTILDLQQNLRDYLEQVASDAKRIDLSRFLHARIEMIKGSYPDIRFVESVPPTTVVVEPKILARIVDNLLSNAAKYNKKGGEVRVGFDEASATLFIEDSGRGIEKPERIFERFYKESETGHGIGMHIVKKLCDSIGVKITIESEPARGTRVALDLGGILSKGSAR